MIGVNQMMKHFSHFTGRTVEEKTEQDKNRNDTIDAKRMILTISTKKQHPQQFGTKENMK